MILAIFYGYSLYVPPLVKDNTLVRAVLVPVYRYTGIRNNRYRSSDKLVTQTSDRRSILEFIQADFCNLVLIF